MNQQAQRKSISSLSANDANIELLGTIVQIFDPRYYEVDPQTGKRIRPREDNKFYDQAGKEIKPEYAAVMNALLDDGTDTIRVVFFQNQLVNLLKINKDALAAYKDNPAEFQNAREELLGKIIKIVGKASKNEMFDRMEFISQLVFPDPSPDEELRKIAEQSKIIE